MTTTANASGSLSAVESSSSNANHNMNHPSAPPTAFLSMLSNATVSVATRNNGATTLPHEQDINTRRKTATQSPQLFWAIRQCEGLHSPAIFSNWEDCSVYVDPMENDGSVVEFKSFPTIQEANAYAFGVLSSATIAIAQDGKGGEAQRQQLLQPQSPPRLLPTTVTPAASVVSNNKSSSLLNTLSGAASSTNKIIPTTTAAITPNAHAKTNNNNNNNNYCYN
mmetsp:Transcript_38707/g.93577  ORF Transcript_38707/g.93577 Transcript_38707/m.93577 type:complete len:223 (-) Transcript_38707:1476-2144(-)